ncbi:hypothetical protein HanRHA438_Chr09g0396141 [Helianthus annuus]|nr:hypothetical protein HanRHA438_Chr09g0396141 [Helianthus annuus]
MSHQMSYNDFNYHTPKLIKSKLHQFSHEILAFLTLLFSHMYPYILISSFILFT